MLNQNKIISFNSKKTNNYILSKRDESLLELFHNYIINENIYYPFYPLRHLNKTFVKFISTSGKPLFDKFVFYSQARNLILDKLILISYEYLSKNKAEISYSSLRKNWVNLFNLAFCTNDIKFNMEALLNKIEEANKMM